MCVLVPRHITQETLFLKVTQSLASEAEVDTAGRQLAHKEAPPKRVM